MPPHDLHVPQLCSPSSPLHDPSSSAVSLASSTSASSSSRLFERSGSDTSGSGPWTAPATPNAFEYSPAPDSIEDLSYLSPPADIRSSLPLPHTPTEQRSPKGSAGSWHLPFAKLSPAPRKAGAGGLPKMERTASQATMRASSSRSKSGGVDALSDKDKEVGLAVDGSYVETTSLVAARALAKHYEDRARVAQGLRARDETEGDGRLNSQYIVVVGTKDRNGRDVYRIRPRSPPPAPSAGASPLANRRRYSMDPSPPNSDLPSFAVTSPSQTAPSHAKLPDPTGEEVPGQTALGRSVRASQSNPVLRQSAVLDSASGFKSTITIIKPDANGFYPSAGEPAAKGLFPFPAPLDPSSSTSEAASSPAKRPVPPAMFLHLPERSLRGSVSDVRLRDSTMRPSSESLRETDVLGRILGWRGGAARTGAIGVGGNSGQELPKIFRTKKGSSASTSTVASSSATASTDSSGRRSGEGLAGGAGLPADLVEETPGSSSMRQKGTRNRAGTNPEGQTTARRSFPDHPFARSSRNPLKPSASAQAGLASGAHETRPSPFGDGVRMPTTSLSISSRSVFLRQAKRSVGSDDSLSATSPLSPSSEGGLPFPAPTAPEEEIEVVVSTEDQEPAKKRQRLERFQDPSIFDLFVDPTYGKPAAPTLFPPQTAWPSTPPADGADPRLSISTKSPSHRDRMASSTSLASSGSATGGTSLAAAHQITLTALGEDDSRFVLWGEVKSNSSGISAQRVSSGGAESVQTGGSGGAASGGGHGGPPVFGQGKRWSRAAKISSGSGSEHLPPHPASSGSGSAGGSVAKRGSVASGSQEDGAQRLVMAATLERWVAELTSKIDPRALADFFLTYRSVISPLHLCQLLISRFEWALGAKGGAPEDDAARRIVRVRTFVVMRHWLLNHFEDDFLRDRELRNCLTAWLNRLARDERIKNAPEDARIVKNLKKVVKQRKETFLAYNLGEAPPTPSKSRAGSDTGSWAFPKEDVLREARSSSTLRGEDVVGATSESTLAKLSDDDVDLEVGELNAVLGSTGFMSRRSVVGQSTDVLPYSEPATGTLYQSRNSLSQPIGLAALTANQDIAPACRRIGVPFAFPQHHSTFSRAFTSTMGTLGRFKRMLKERSATQANAPPCIHPGNFEDFDLHPNETGDLLYVRGGLDRYLAFFDLKHGDISSELSVTDHAQSRMSLSSPTTSDSLDTPGQSGAEEVRVRIAEDSGFGISGPADPNQTLAVDADDRMPEGQSLHESMSKETIKSEVSALAPRRPMRRACKNVGDLLMTDANPLKDGPIPHHAPLLQPNRPTSVQLDDIDLSDESDDEVLAAAPRKLRRLPAATDLKHAITLRRPSFRRSIDTTSSAGTRRIPSVAASIFRRHTRHSAASADDMPNGVAIVDNFVAEGLESDDEEPGDVEAALRRLEGVIDADREKEKARKVEAQMQKSKKASERRRVSMSSDGISDVGDEADDDASLATSERSMPATEEVGDTGAFEIIQPPRPQARASFAPMPRPSRDTLAATETLRTEFTATPGDRSKRPVGRRISRKTSLYRMFAASQTGSARASLRPPPSLPLPPIHRSFLLNCRTEVMARQFCLIERDLLRAVTWQELLGGTWQDSARADALSWEAFLKDRAREKMNAKTHGTKPAARDIPAVIARFNLTCNWVASEIVLTSGLEERVQLLGKFIRLAFKCYRQNNFQTLTQIIHGLQTSHVERLRKTWAKLGIWENRMFRDLKAFTSHLRNFKSLRSIQDQLAEAYGPPGQAATAAETVQMLSSANRPATLSGCIPFLGLYLRDLTVNEELPTYLDPTDPRVPAKLDPETGEVPEVAAPEVLDHLLPGEQSDRPVYPLVNVHKHRIVASVVQKLLAFQEAAVLYPYDADSSLFLTCLKIKTLDAEQLRRSSHICEP